MENVIANDRNLSAMKLNVSELLDLSFLDSWRRKGEGTAEQSP
jgi:hypothetical protein